MRVELRAVACAEKCRDGALVLQCVNDEGVEEWRVVEGVEGLVLSVEEQWVVGRGSRELNLQGIEEFHLNHMIGNL